MSASKISRKIFEPKKDEVGGHFKILHNEDLGDLYRLPSIVRLMTSVMLGCGTQGVHTEFLFGETHGKPFSWKS